MAEIYDIFLSHGTPDKPWVETLTIELEALGLRVFLDAYEIGAGDVFPMTLSNALRDSRFLVLILSPHAARPWVKLEWASYMAEHGPLGRILPVMLEALEVPTILKAFQRIDGTHRDAARVAEELAAVVGRPAELADAEADARRLVIGQDLVFVLGRDGDELTITNPEGRTRRVTPPWRVDNRFGLALHFYDRLTRESVTTAQDRAEIFERARTLGNILFELLFEGEDRALLDRAMMPGRPRPLITLRSDDHLLLSLPWELLHADGSFLLRDARVDLARSTLGEVGPRAILREPEGFLKLVVNVSAPEGSGLEYEAESYRITKALSDRCPFVPTELGTLEDLVETVQAERPTAIHFSGHGTPGALIFEDDEGRSQKVPITDMLLRLRERVSGGLPPLFYLASCHGNDPGAPATAAPDKAEEGSESSAAQLHREGVPQVVGYYGPIVDELSTRAEVAFYRAIAEGGTTRYAIRQARAALAATFAEPITWHRPGEVVEAPRGGLTAPPRSEDQHSHPFAWAQLVFYHRGPDRSLSKPAVDGVWRREDAPRRTFIGTGNRKVLSLGFIGRRNELHRVRRWLRRGERVFVFQGLGGLGKSTLAFHVLPMLGSTQVVTLWCQETDDHPDRAEALVGQLLEFCRERFGDEWKPVVQEADLTVGADPARRFEVFLNALRQKVDGRLVVYLDNVESLLVGPKDEDPHDETAFGEWLSSALAGIWRHLVGEARDGDGLYVMASCRYRNQDFAGALLPVSPLPADALFRLTGWYPALRQLSVANRARLVECLAGHPRAVQLANGRLSERLATWKRGGELPWRMPGDRDVGQERRDDRLWVMPEDVTVANLEEQEWKALVEPILPTVERKLWDDLLLAQIWEHVLDERARRMLYRMTLLRQPWQWELMAVLGEQEEDEKAAFTTAKRLLGSSLVEQMKLRRAAGDKVENAHCFVLHPTTTQFISKNFYDVEALCQKTHRRLGEHLEAEARSRPFIDIGIEAGFHLFQGGEFDRASEILESASQWLQNTGHVRRGLEILKPFLTEQVPLGRGRSGHVLGTVGMAYADLGEVEKAIGYYEQQLLMTREIGDRCMEGNALGNLGVAYYRLGDVDEATDYYEQQLVIAREIGDRRMEGNALGNLGVAHYRLGEVKKAIAYSELRLLIARETGDRHGVGSALMNLANAYADLGEPNEAIGYYERMLIIAREIGDRQGEGNALNNLGLVYVELGQLIKAIDYFEHALMIAREIDNRRGEGNALGDLGLAHYHLGEMKKAIDFYERRLVVARKIGDRHGEGSALMNLSNAHADLGDAEKAKKLRIQALELARESMDPRIVNAASQSLDKRIPR